jgi:hypothetical protein
MDITRTGKLFLKKIMLSDQVVSQAINQHTSIWLFFSENMFDGAFMSGFRLKVETHYAQADAISRSKPLCTGRRDLKVETIMHRQT